jgi:hypothetical protein
MTASFAEQISEAKATQPAVRTERSSRKPAANDSPPAVTPRFFLAKTGANGSAPSLDRELANEAEAMIESLKSGLTYYSVVEYRAVPDCSGKQPIVKKETVRRNG